MSKSAKCIAGSVLVLAAVVALAVAHCQVPCGIYGDETRFALMREHVATIEKSMRQVGETGAGSAQSSNQLVRWVVNKEDHAAELAEIVTYYFMAQRVKPATDDEAGRDRYVRQITLLHKILIQSMKAKQSTDPAVCDELRSLIDRFEKAYFQK